jgi:hypothetical protein
MDPLDPKDTPEPMPPSDTIESFDQLVERTARAWFEDNGPHGDFTPMGWDKGHPDDKAFAIYTARFILTEAGLG